MITYDAVTERYTIDNLTESELLFFKLSVVIETTRAYGIEDNSRCPPARTLPELESLLSKMQTLT